MKRKEKRMKRKENEKKKEKQKNKRTNTPTNMHSETHNTQTNVSREDSSECAICVQSFDDSEIFCNSHDLSHFTAFFIVVGAKTSIAESVI